MVALAAGLVGALASLVLTRRAGREQVWEGGAADAAHGDVDDAMPVTFGPLKRHGTGFGLGFSVKVGDTNWNPHAPLGEYGWGGLLSTHYWASPKDELVVVTMEQTIPYDFLLENELKPLIYDAIED